MSFGLCTEFMAFGCWFLKTGEVFLLACCLQSHYSGNHCTWHTQISSFESLQFDYIIITVCLEPAVLHDS